MKKELSLTKFEKWEKAYLANMDLPFQTTSAFLKLSELEAFVNEIRELNADGVRICFLRFEIGRDEPQLQNAWPDGKVPLGCQWVDAGKGFSQAAVALVPTKKFMLNEERIIEAEDLVNEEKKTVLVLMPGGEAAGPTGHKPPQSGKTEKAGG